MGVVGLLCCPPLFADAPYEKYHVAFKDISKDILKNTIGILTINSGIKKGVQLKTYLRSGNKFTFNKILKVKETIPISNFGYQPGIDELYIENYRYPIVNKFEHYLCIVYDPKKNLKAWVNIEEVEVNFYITPILLDSIPIPGEFFVDIFYFTEDGTRKIYKDPQKDADSILISKNLFEYSLLKIVEQKNEFIKIEGTAWVSGDVGKGSIEMSAWIKIRDEKGNLTIWIKYVDLY